MVIGDDKAAKIQDLLKQLSSADTFQSVAITRQIRDIATENPKQGARHNRGDPVAIEPTQK